MRPCKTNALLFLMVTLTVSATGCSDTGLVIPFIGFYGYKGTVVREDLLKDGREFVSLSFAQQRKVLAEESDKTMKELQSDYQKHAIVPGWYMRSLKYQIIEPSYSGYDKTFSYTLNVKNDVRLLLTCLAPFFLVLLTVVFVPRDRPPRYQLYAAVPVLVFGGCEAVAVLASAVLEVVLKVFVGDYYIPSGLIACYIYMAVIFTASVVAPFALFLERTGSRSGVPEAAVRGMVSAGRPTRKRLLAVAVKAVVVAVITSLGSQLGGWIGGIVAVVSASVLTALIGTDGHTPLDHHHPGH
jgi:hypothetical protein